MDKKKTGILLAVICVIVVIGILIFTTKNSGSGKSAEEENSETVSQAQNVTEEEFTPETENEQEESEEETETAQAKEELSENQADDDGKVSGGNVPAGSAGNNSGSIESADNSDKQETISLPYSIPGTSLVLENVASYDGIYLEDGSDVSVSGVAAAILKNEGSTPLEYVDVTLQGNNSTLEFIGSDIQAGATIVIQEANKASYQSDTWTNCTAETAEIAELEMSEDSVSVKENEDGSLTVTNLTAEAIPCVRVFYKFYMSDENAWVGGITYTAKLTGLGAGASQTVTPSHYAVGSSQVVMVRTYDTAE